MSTPDEAVRDQLAAQAADLSGAAPSAPAVDISSAAPAQVDTDALLARLQALEAQAEAAKPAPPGPPNTDPVVNGSGEIQHALKFIYARLAQVEKAVGVDAVKAIEELV